MSKAWTVRGAEEFGRTRLSDSFFMREFLHSEIANVQGIGNLPDDPALAIRAGQGLCRELLEPLQKAFGRISIRSGYRAPAVNSFGNLHRLSCASNENDRARHIWDQRSADGGIGAMATVVVPWLIDRLSADSELTWASMAWWIHDHLPYSELQIFPKLAAFNIGWHQYPKKRILSFIEPRGLLTKPGMANHRGDHRALYVGFPQMERPLSHDAVLHSVCGSA